MTERKIAFNNSQAAPPRGGHGPAAILVGGSLLLLVLIIGVGLAFFSVNVSFTLAFAFLAVVVLGVVMIRRPEIGLLLMIFAIPLEDFNQISTIGGISPIKLLGIGIIGAYVIHHIVFKNDDPLVFVPQNIFIVLLFLAVLISNIIAADQDYAIGKTFKLLRMIAFFILVINIVRSPGAVRRVFWTMIAAGLLSAGYGMYEYYLRPDLLQDMRVSGTLDDPMGFAYTMVILLPLVWYEIKTMHHPLARIGLAASGLLFLYAILLSGTRSAMLAAVVVMFLAAIREKHPVLNISVVVILFVGAVVFMPEQVRSRVGLSIDPDKAAEASTERRLTYLDFGWELFKESPWIGTGLGGFAEKYSQSDYQYLRSPDDARRIAHNMYIEIVTGTGLLGFIPFMLLMLSPLVALQHITNQQKYDGLADMAKILQLSLIAFLFVGFFSSSQYDKPLWLLIGLASILPVITHDYQVSGQVVEIDAHETA